MVKIIDLIPFLENLTGEKANINGIEESLEIEIFKPKQGIGYSQFNEILLLLGFDRISKEFFQFLCDGRINYEDSSEIKDINTLDTGIEEFTEIALLNYGNIKFAFKTLSKDSEILKKRIFDSSPNDEEDFKKRHEPIKKILPINPDETYYLGYFIEKDLKEKLKDPNDKKAIKDEKKRQEIVEIGKKNDIAYLASDHLDVYVATSMRKKHEFLYVNKIVEQLSNHKALKDLKLRIFNPTLAYCKNRIDKGLAEALMLKRAKCTLYLAQESDTLGKDSELASTLAQGKTVVAYIPIGNKEYVDELLFNLSKFEEGHDEKKLVIEQLKIFNPELAWGNGIVHQYFTKENDVSLVALKDELYKSVLEYYNKRAEGLKEDHPLGIQVNLTSGVANGVLVVRDLNICAELIRDIILNSLKFKVDRDPLDKMGNILKNYIFLKEEKTQSIYRVKTGQELLTNSFWNFYLDKIKSKLNYHE